MSILAIFDREQISKEALDQFRKRRATRGIVYDDNNHIALLKPRNKNWYGLPGGGVETEETFEQGLIRECKEEIGCDIKIEKTLGVTLEYRKTLASINESHGFVSRVIGEKGLPIPGDETNDSDILWVPLTEAIDLMENTPIQEELYDQYCIERDLVFLKKA